MDFEFHYYIIYFLALRAGLSEEDAYTLAYSSQYTDDNTIIYRVKSDDGTYRNYISQTLNILKPQRKLIRIYPVFHFPPGSREQIFTKGLARKDGKAHLLMTVENSEIGLLLLREAIRRGDIFQIGIASHGYADTFAHQNFVGCYDSLNGMKGFPERLTPNVGHADVGRKPDVVNLIWEDVRLRSDLKIINNRDRILLAARLIYRELCKLKGKDPEDEEEIVNEIKEAIGEPSFEPSPPDSRIRKYKKMIGDSFLPYKQDGWLNEAVEFGPFSFLWRSINILLKRWSPIFTFTIPVKAKSDFYKSRWFKFQESIKEHQRMALKILKPTLEMMEIERL